MKLDHRRLAAAALLVSACAHPPLAELDAAWRAYQTASSAGAAEKSPARFQEAGAALVEGQDFIDQGDFDQARESLKRARRLADAASGGQSAPRDEGIAEPRGDGGFTDAPTSNEGVQLSPLVKPGAAAKAAPVAPEVAAPSVPAPPASAPALAAAAAAPSPAPPPTMVDGALPERIEAPTPDAPIDAPQEIPSGDGTVRQAPTPEDTARAIREERERLKQAAAERAGAGGSAGAPTAPTPAAEPAAAEPEPEERAAAPAAAPASGAQRTYVVKKGETLYEIARAQYKTEAAWKVIYDANRDRLANPGDVRAGMKLVLPPASAAAAAASGGAPSTKSAAQTYTVRKGENLHTIAEKMYGAQSYWTLIRDANKDKLTDADEVRAGTKLVLPPKPGSR